jgi:tetratricopeptide (TPR) repeat protein
MLPSEEIIAQYERAAANHDTGTAMDALTGLDLVELDDANWTAIRRFCDARKMPARLELITRRYLAGQGKNSAPAYLWLAKRLLASGDKNGAKLAVSACLATTPDAEAHVHDIVDCLLAAGAYQDALDIIRRQLGKDPHSFAWKALECRALWRLGEKKLVAKKLKTMESSIGDETSLWTWYAALGLEFDAPRAIEMGAKRLYTLLCVGKGHLTRHICAVFTSVGCSQELKSLIEHADPAQLTDLQDLEVIFDEAIAAGAYGSAQGFGNRILALSDNAYVKAKLRSISVYNWIDGHNQTQSGLDASQPDTQNPTSGTLLSSAAPYIR